MDEEIISDAEDTSADTTDAGKAGGADEGLGYPKWMSSLPDDLKTNKVLAQFKSIGDAGKTLAELRSDDKVLRIPGEDASDEEKAAFLTKLGRPESPDKYTFTKPDLPEASLYSPEVETAFREFAFAEGMSDKTASKIWNWYYDLARNGYAEQQKAEEKAFNDSVDALKNEWKGDDYKKNVAIAVRAFTEIGKGHESILNEKFGNGKLGNHPAFLKLFYEIGKSIMSDTASFDASGGGNVEKTEGEQALNMFPSMKKK